MSKPGPDGGPGSRITRSPATRRIPNVGILLPRLALAQSATCTPSISLMRSCIKPYRLSCISQSCVCTSSVKYMVVGGKLPGYKYCENILVASMLLYRGEPYLIKRGRACVKYVVLIAILRQEANALPVTDPLADIFSAERWEGLRAKGWSDLASLRHAQCRQPQSLLLVLRLVQATLEVRHDLQGRVAAHHLDLGVCAEAFAALLQEIEPLLVRDERDVQRPRRLLHDCGPWHGARVSEVKVGDV